MSGQNSVKFHFDHVFYAEPLRYGPVLLYQIGDLNCGPGLVEPGHVQCCAEITYVVSGTGRFCTDGEWRSISKGNLYVNTKGEFHSWESDLKDPLRFFYLGFELDPDCAELSSAAEFFSRPISGRIADGGGSVYDSFLGAFREMSGVMPCRDIILQTCLLQIILYSYRCFHGADRREYYLPDERSSEELVYNMIRHIDQHVETIGSLSELSDHMGYSYPYLSKVFSQVMLRTLKDYFFDKRFTRARELLDQSMSVTNVASALGYDSINSFSRAFRNYCGVSPSEYRRSGRIERSSRGGKERSDE